MNVQVTHRHGVEVLSWFASELPKPLPIGTRLFSFSDYHTAPQGTRARMGRKNGTGPVLEKVGTAWRNVTDHSAVHPTPYWLEGKPSYVTGQADS